MIWRNHSNGVFNVLINNVNILSEKVKNYLLGFPNAASQKKLTIFDHCE
jgi:hypothetical protein